MSLMTTQSQQMAKAVRLLPLSSEFAPRQRELLSVKFKQTLQLSNLEEALKAITEAEMVIQAQEERIRQLENLALTDELTGLVNRRGLMLAMKREIAAARRDEKVWGMVIIVDLDGFKLINDTYGHAVGDLYLQTVATVLTDEVRSSDIVARLGGDEFAILLTSISPEMGAILVERIRQSFASKVMLWQEKTLPLRASFGAEAYTGTETVEAVMDAADMKLYKSKSYFVQSRNGKAR